MSNLCSNRIRLLGSRPALLDALALLSQGDDLHFVEVARGSNRYAVVLDCYDENAMGQTPVAGRFIRHDTLLARLLVDAPVRYRGFGSDGWQAPQMLEKQGFDLDIRSAMVPDELIEAGDSEALMVLSLSCDTKNSPCTALLRALSRRLPWLVVEVDYQEVGNGVHGAAAWQAGQEIAAVTVDQVLRSDVAERLGVDADADDFDLDEHVQQAQDDAMAEALRDKVSCVSYEHAVARAHPYPAWDAVTEAAAREGIAGVLELASDSQDSGDLLAASLSAARHAGRCSWLDFAVWSQPHVEELLDRALASPGEKSEDDRGLSPFGLDADRTCDILRACAEGGERPELAAALIDILASSDTRLASGEHPIGLLVEAGRMSMDSDVIGGLDRVVAAFVAGLPPLPEAPLVGREFLVHESEDRQQGLLNLVVHELIESQADAELVKRIGSVKPYGPSLNPGYRFDVAADRLLRSVLHAGLQVTPQGLRVALAAGIDKEFLLRSCLWASPMAALQAFESLQGGFETLSLVSMSYLHLVCTIRQSDDALSYYQAKMREHDLRSAIDSALAEPAARPRPRSRRSL